MERSCCCFTVDELNSATSVISGIVWPLLATAAWNLSMATCYTIKAVIAINASQNTVIIGLKRQDIDVVIKCIPGGAFHYYSQLPLMN